MRKRNGPPVKKFSYYLPPGIGESFTGFSQDAPSAHVVGAEIAWMSLPADAREKILQAARDLTCPKAVATARRVIRDAIADQILLEHSRSLPRSEQARIIQGSLPKTK